LRLGSVVYNLDLHRNGILETCTAPTKVKSRERAYSAAYSLNRCDIILQDRYQIQLYFRQ